jgi:hypothetical protein
MNYFLILFLFVILAIKCKSSGFDNNKFVSSICNDSIIKRTDTVIGYVIKYDFDDINKYKHGSLESYYYENGKITTKACSANYKYGFLSGEMSFFAEDGKIITRYENIFYDKNRGFYTAKIFVYNVNLNLKEEGYVKTTDELDFSPIFDNADCCFDKIRLNEWKYYK